TKCGANVTGLCFQSKLNLSECEYWVPTSSNSPNKATKKATLASGQNRVKKQPTTEGVEWTGFPLRLTEIEQISRRANPLIIA
ncbi:hypothetical protein, partial [Hymenobacter defluvii]